MALFLLLNNAELDEKYGFFIDISFQKE